MGCRVLQALSFLDLKRSIESSIMVETLFHIHLVSDATGETINNMARACLVQFEQIKVREHHWNLTRTQRQLDLVMEGVRQWPGLVLYTFVDEALRDSLQRVCEENKITSLSVLDPVLKSMANYFGVSFSHAPGRQHVLDADYFARIDAMDYALAKDDGHGVDHLSSADVIILGVSRTSKTPTCIYLANRGIKAANIPLIPGQPMPVDIVRLEKPLVVGLTKDPESLVEIRRSRLHLLQSNPNTSYVDPEKVHEEVIEARRFFTRIGCPVIDVSRRSIEETAAEIIILLNRRQSEGERPS